MCRAREMTSEEGCGIFVADFANGDGGHEPRNGAARSLSRAHIPNLPQPLFALLNLHCTSPGYPRGAPWYSNAAPCILGLLFLSLLGRIRWRHGLPRNPSLSTAELPSFLLWLGSKYLLEARVTRLGPAVWHCWEALEPSRGGA